MTPAGVHRSRRWSWLLLAYPLLVLAGFLTHRQGYSLAAIVLLLTVVLGPALCRRQPRAWLSWLALVAGAVGLAWQGWARWLVDLVPVLVNLLLAWVFARTLRPGRQPLVCQIILAVEGAPRLALPGVARYGRQLTAFWAGLLVVQAVVIGVLLACAVPGGLLLAWGIAPPLAVPAGWAQGYMQGGAFALLAVVFVAEYVFRRWKLRHMAHSRLPDLMRQTALRWPQLLRGQRLDEMTTTRFRTTLCFDADHPSFAGHFPGRPLVAGVLLLEQVALGLRAWRGQRLARVVEAKFVAPLRPAEPAQLTLEPAGARVRFEICREDTVLARGIIEGAA